MKTHRDRDRTVAPSIGVDIGRVIINGDGPDTQFFGHSEREAMRTPAVPGAFAAVAELVRQFDGRVHLVSKCGPRIQARSLAWLDHHDFWAATGVDRAKVRFCRERRDKAVHAVRLGLTHFVDDRFDVLTHLVGLVERMYLFGPQRKRSTQLHGMLATPRWADVLADLAHGGLST
ncbi:MAG TPA: hypothetical protein VK034_15775 [Enhygromyxa sp.]|nr:hypothetical protein [Enhygromyxa sp.]